MAYVSEQLALLKQWKQEMDNQIATHQKFVADAQKQFADLTVQAEQELEALQASSAPEPKSKPPPEALWVTTESGDRLFVLNETGAENIITLLDQISGLIQELAQSLKK